MKVIALRQFAVFMNAGSYVIRPKSAGAALICRKSMARIVPSWIGSSYFFPVRLSTIVSVSAIRESVGSRSGSLFTVTFFTLGFRHPLCRHPVRAIGPAREILDLAAFAAERPPRQIRRLPATEYTQRRVRRRGHPDYCSGSGGRGRKGRRLPSRLS